MPSVILLDDDDILRNALAEILELDGHTVTEGNNGLAAFNLQKSNPHDLMITDLFMPRVNGMEAIMNARYEFPDMRIIAMSGGSKYLTHDFLQHTTTFGASAFLRKPFGKKEFLNTVNIVLNTPVNYGYYPHDRAKAS